ncbi:MAG: M23 family metallopeptidase [candidate division Zixibacteria bacterium]|nr:M23 family metallopeptidase [candidate division Zixibacteria bacterium]
MLRLGLISVILLLVYSPAIPADPSSSATTPFAWPLKRELQISSGFGDGRPGRFHMGIDLRTGGKIGAPVYAPEDGFIRRISTSYFGYGKGLYLAGKSGRTYVFGHLNDFNKKIGSFVEQRQLASRRYYQDIKPDAADLPVKKGELIAHSGQTGAGAPHLHFEIRDAENRPLNPLLFPGIRLKDTTPPKFKAVWLTYLDDHSLFADGQREIKLKPIMDKTGRTRVTDTILVTGRFAVKTAVEDVVAPGSFAIGPQRLTLTIDGRVYHSVAYDRLDYAENKLSLLDRDPDPDKNDYARVYALFRKPGNILSNYQSEVPGDGTFADTVEGFHTIVIEAADAFGNTRRLEFTIRYSPFKANIADAANAGLPDSLTKSSIAPSAEPGTFKIIDDGFLFTVPTTGGIDRLTGAIATDRGMDTLAFRRISQSRFAGFYRPAADVAFIDRIVIVGPSARVSDTIVLGMHHLFPGQPAQIKHGDDLTIEAGAGDLFGNALLMVKDTLLPPPASGRFIHRPFALLPDWLAFASPIELIVQVPVLPDTNKTAFYIHKEGNRWSWIGRRVDVENDWLTATVSGGGAYAVLSDTVAPTITDLNIAEKASLTSGRPQIRCTVADELSGFEDDRNFEITIDGKWIIPEYDIDRKLLTGKPHWTIHGSSHRLEITVRDRCGNTTTVARTFHVLAKTGPR